MESAQSQDESDTAYTILMEAGYEMISGYGLVVVGGV